jgi:hypothetical protein
LIGLINITPEEIPNNDMENRIDRKDDESLYQPQIHSKRIRALYQLKQVTGKPMTVLVDQAIRDLTESYRTENLEEDPVMEQVRDETWEEISEYKEFLDRLDYLKCLVELEKIKGNVEPEVFNNLIENDNRG